jgi:hypothetical protein
MRPGPLDIYYLCKFSLLSMLPFLPNGLPIPARYYRDYSDKHMLSNIMIDKKWAKQHMQGYFKKRLIITHCLRHSTD